MQVWHPMESREHSDDESHENEVLQQSPDRTIVQMPDGHGSKAAYAYALIHFHFFQ